MRIISTVDRCKCIDIAYICCPRKNFNRLPSLGAGWGLVQIAVCTVISDGDLYRIVLYRSDALWISFDDISAFAQDKHAVQIELLGENRIKLFVSEEYLAYASEEGISDFIDFYWMANAFIVDYIADTMRANGFVRGSVSSYDGFVRNLDDLSGSEYAFNIFNRVGNTVHQAGVMR